jgi:hypothetical protein
MSKSMNNYLAKIDELIRQSERGELRVRSFELPELRDPRLQGHARARAIVEMLLDRGLSIEEICFVTGYTEVAVRHHLWVLEQKRANG